MKKVFCFFSVSLDGYFEGPEHDISWHNVDREFNQYAADMLESIGVELYGRRTYELMAGFWPSYKPESDDPNDARVADLMNSQQKVVFSTTLDSVNWAGRTDNVRLVNDNVAEEVRKLRAQPGKDIAAGGSDFCVSLIEMGLLDEVRVVVTPVVIGAGTPLFHGLKKQLNLELTDTRRFKSGNVLLTYSIVK